MKQEELNEIFKDFDVEQQQADLKETTDFFSGLYEKIDDTDLVDEIIRQHAMFGQALSAPLMHLRDKLDSDDEQETED